MVVDELIDSAAGHDILVGGLKTRVHVVVPVLSADGRGPLMCAVCVVNVCQHTIHVAGREKLLNRTSGGTAKAGCSDCTMLAETYPPPPPPTHTHTPLQLLQLLCTYLVCFVPVP